MTKKKSSSKSKKSPLVQFIRIVLVVVIIVCVGYGTYFIVNKLKKDEITVPDFVNDTDNRIKIQVFNGCRNTKATLEVNKILRESGYIDVVDLEKSPGNIYPHTMIIDRKGNPDKMKQLALHTGLNEKDIVIMKSNQFLDATLVVGVDYENFLNGIREKYVYDK